MDVEKWRRLIEYPMYEISTFGNIRNKETKYILKQYSKLGYKHINILNKDNKKILLLVHRLVAQSFITNSENKPTVNHKDHNPSNNNINNLEWATYKEQACHKRKPNLAIYEYTGTRPVWRICNITNSKLQRYNSIKEASKWVFDNKLTKVNEFGNGNNIKTKICSVIRKGTTNGKNTNKYIKYERKTAYGFKWEYDLSNENIYNNEIWKEIPQDFVNFNGYMVSSYGRVKNNKGRITNGYSKEDDYLVANINKKGYFIHRLVAYVFIPNPENKPIVNHIDGNKQNPSLDNLEWVTYTENSNHAVLINKIKTKPIIQYDLNMNQINTFNSVKEASEILNIGQSTVSNICNKKYTLPPKYYLEWEVKP